MSIESEHSVIATEATCPRIEIEASREEDTVSGSEADENREIETLSDQIDNSSESEINTLSDIIDIVPSTFTSYDRSVYSTPSASNHDMTIPIIPSSTDLPPTLLSDDLQSYGNTLPG